MTESHSPDARRLPPAKSGGGTRATHRWIEIGLVALFATIITWCSNSVWPSWDDTHVALLDAGRYLYRVPEGGPAEVPLTQYAYALTETDLSHPIVAAHPDRPWLGWIWQTLSDARCLRSASLIVHGATLFLLGLATTAWWNNLFPRLASCGYGAAAACLAISPVYYGRLSFVMMNPTFSATVGTMLVSGGSALLVRQRSVGLQRFWTALTLAAGFFAACISEYGAVAAMVAAGLLICQGWVRGTAEDRRRYVAAAVLLAAVAVAGYVVHVSSRNEMTLRTEVDLPVALRDMVTWRWKVIVPRWLNALWYAAAGEVISALSEANFQKSPATLAAIALGVVAAGVVFRLTRSRGIDLPEGITTGRLTRVCGALAIVIGIAVLPFLVMGRSFHRSEAESRCWIAMLPVLGLLSLTIWMALATENRARMAAAFIMFVSWHSLLTQGSQAVAERRMGDAWAAAIAPHLHRDEFTLIVLSGDRPFLNSSVQPRHLAAWFALHPDFPTGRFFVVEADTKEASELGVSAGFSEPEITVNYCGRGVGARGKADRILWVSIFDDGAPTIVAGSPGEVPKPVPTVPKSESKRDS